MSEARGRTGRIRRAAGSSVAVAGLVFAGYLLLAGSASAGECATGGVLAVCMAVWVRVAARLPDWEISVRLGRLAPLARALAGVPSASVRTALWLAAPRGAPGRNERRPYRYGPLDDPGERGRRAIDILAMSLAPASYVLRSEPGHDEIDMHAIAAADPADRGSPA